MALFDPLHTRYMPLHGMTDHGTTDHGTTDHGTTDHGMTDHGTTAAGCAGGKPAAHPLHRYITYEKRRFSTRYTPATCRYTGAAQGGGGHANGSFATVIVRRYRGKPAAHPLHRYTR